MYANEMGEEQARTYNTEEVRSYEKEEEEEVCSTIILQLLTCLTRVEIQRQTIRAKV
jgi:hypothetical protein